MIDFRYSGAEAIVKRLTVWIAAAGVCCAISGQEMPPLKDTVEATIGRANSPKVVAAVDSLHDSSSIANAPVSPQPDAPAKQKPRKIKILKRKFDVREQVGIALGMMAFVLIMMTTSQAWNPD